MSATPAVDSLLLTINSLFFNADTLGVELRPQIYNNFLT